MEKLTINDTKLYFENYMIVPFDDRNVISCDNKGNYFKLDFNTFLPNRYYKVLIKVKMDGGDIEKTIDDSIVRKDNAVFSKRLDGFIRTSDAVFVERHSDWVTSRMVKECEDIHELKQECVYSLFMGKRYHKSRVEYVVAQNGNFDFIPLERREEYLQENLK